MPEERFRKYLAFRSPELLGGADTRELANDLAREWDGVVYVRDDVADDEVQQLRSLNQTQQESIAEFQQEHKELRAQIDKLVNGDFVCSRCGSQKK